MQIPFLPSQDKLARQKVDEWMARTQSGEHGKTKQDRGNNLSPTTEAMVDMILCRAKNFRNISVSTPLV